jgi:hypothetical protein
MDSVPAWIESRHTSPLSTGRLDGRAETYARARERDSVAYRFVSLRSDQISHAKHHSEIVVRVASLNHRWYFWVTFRV